MITIDPEHFRARILQDALTQATAQHWEHRATQLQAVGNPSCDLAALNCRRHAALIRESYPEPISPEVQAALNEVT